MFADARVCTGHLRGRAPRAERWRVCRSIVAILIFLACRNDSIAAQPGATSSRASVDEETIAVIADRSDSVETFPPNPQTDAETSASPPSGDPQVEAPVDSGQMSGLDEREDEPVDDDFPISVRYRHNFAGGFLRFSSPEEAFVANLQNHVTLDGTFFSLPDMPTPEKGFNIPFLRTFLYGHAAKYWHYQLSTQSHLGQFNILDGFVNFHWDDRVNVRAGRGLSPFLYEYFAFSPAWEPVIKGSLMTQLAGKRQEGLLVFGNIAEGRFQYQAGVFNGVAGAYYDLDAGVDAIASFTLTPFAGSESKLDHLGFGFSFQTGDHRYALSQTGTGFVNGAGEPTTNINYVTSSGVPFFEFNTATRAQGNQTKIAPHFFLFGRFSVLGEYLHCARQLSLNGVEQTTVQSGYYVNTSYWLTGEKYHGNGLGGYTTIEPLRPFRMGQGPGAWEVASQFSQLSLGAGNFAFAAAPNTYASRCHQLMLGVNWWPNKYVRLSLDNVGAWFNHSIPLAAGKTADRFNTVWFRTAMFF